ncbi:MAG: outer membrane lipoprotein-sorting protein [Nitrospirae bacterium]|nr:outer membrane lipoprotein-sorting protein [Candidatus Manganitrophaceae bacterium]
MKIMKFYSSMIVGLAFFAFATTTWAGETLSVDMIVKKTIGASYYSGKDGRAQVSMTMKDSQGRKRKRRFTILRRNVTEQTGGDQQFYVYFHRPADVNKTVFMVWKKVEQQDERWLYLPALDLVKRIAAGDERTSFVGSDFFYEDVSGRGFDEDKHTLLETTDNYYVVENRPKNPKAVEFSTYTAWIHKKTFLPVKIIYYNNRNEEYRVYEVLKVGTVQGYPTITQARMKDLRTKSETLISYSKVQYDIGLPQEIFTERYLRNPPRKYLR